MMTDDMELLRQFTANQSEIAFTTLVERHVNLVYSAAFRQLADPHLARDVTQTVFILLARKAKSMSPRTILPGWLYRTTRFASSAALRQKLRRQRREQEAHMQFIPSDPTTEACWEELEPFLDEAMGELRDTDRDALVLRFFQKKSMQDVGAALGLNEQAAKKRVSRGLEKLRRIFAKRGIVFTSVVIASAVSANAVQAAPGLLAGSVTAAVSQGAASGFSSMPLVQATIDLMTWVKIKAAGIITVLLLICTAAGLAVVRRTTTDQQPVLASVAPRTNLVTARQVFRDVVAATMAAQTMSADFIYSVHTQNPAQEVRGSVRMMKPNLIRITYSSIARPAYPSLIASDGTTRYTFTSSSFRGRFPYSSPQGFDSLLEAKHASGLILGGGKITTNIVEPDGSNLQLWDSVAVQAFFGPERAINRHLGDIDNFDYEGEETINTVNYRVLYHHVPSADIAGGERTPFDQRIYVGPDNLIHRYVLEFMSAGNPGKQVMELSNIQVNVPMRPEDFAFSLPQL